MREHKNNNFAKILDFRIVFIILKNLSTDFLLILGLFYVKMFERRENQFNLSIIRVLK